jgi:hypothetical protein
MVRSRGLEGDRTGRRCSVGRDPSAILAISLRDVEKARQRLAKVLRSIANEDSRDVAVLKRADRSGWHSTTVTPAEQRPRPHPSIGGAELVYSRELKGERPDGCAVSSHAAACSGDSANHTPSDSDTHGASGGNSGTAPVLRVLRQRVTAERATWEPRPQAVQALANCQL